MNPGSGRQRGIGGENKNEGNEVKGNLFLMKYKSLWLAMFFCMNTTYTYNIITVHSISTSDETTFIILFTVNIVAHVEHP